MADYRRQHDEKRHDRDWPEMAGDEVRSGSDDTDARRRWHLGDRDERSGYLGDRYTRYESPGRGSRWEGASDDRAYGTYRIDDRDFHDRHQQHLPRAGNAPVWGPRERGGYWRQYEAARVMRSGTGHETTSSKTTSGTSA
jgi:hypothetical protein